MNAKTALARPHVATTIVAVALAIVIGIGLLAGVAALFQRDGVPFGQQVIAERACADFLFESERRNCVSSYLAASQHRNVASR